MPFARASGLCAAESWDRTPILADAHGRSCRPLGTENDIAASFDNFRRPKVLRDQRSDLIRLPGHEVKPAFRTQQYLRFVDKELGNGALSVVRRIGQHHIKGVRRQLAHLPPAPLSSSFGAGETEFAIYLDESWPSEDQDTGFHDYDLSYGAVTVVDGELIEERLRLGGTPERNRYTAGQTFSVSVSDIHCVSQNGTVPAVSLHAYSPPLRRMSAYVVEPCGKLRRESISYAEELRPLGAGS